MSRPTTSGLLLVDKPAGCTSHDVVQRARRILGERRIGHCGTLDPGATGLLLLTVGHATRLTRFLISAPKVYEGDIRFGVATDTYDALGAVTAEAPIDDLTDAQVGAAMERFVGTYEQVAPPYSAKKVEGRKLYELARQGETVPESRKEITVYSLEPTSSLEAGVVSVRLGCSSGTYVRSLAHDLGAALGVGGHLESLRRVRIGPFDVADAIPLDDLQEREEPAAGSSWIPFDAIELPFARLTLDVGQGERIGHGQTVLVRDLDAEEGDWIQLVDARARFVAVGVVNERIGRGVAVVQPRIVFPR